MSPPPINSTHTGWTAHELHIEGSKVGRHGKFSFQVPSQNCPDASGKDINERSAGHSLS